MNTEIDDNEASEADVCLADDAVPVCPHCLTEITEQDDYCPKCTRNVGQLTGIIPFVNIPFQAQFVGDLWRESVHGGRLSVPMRVFTIMLLAVMAPLIILVGLPIFLYGLLCKGRAPRPPQT
jgi:hypothetical protein